MILKGLGWTGVEGNRTSVEPVGGRGLFASGLIARGWNGRKMLKDDQLYVYGTTL